ncbi:MAG: NAD-dependent deacylase [Deltaproteobacteria bacterium]|nr:NAD-dependent deacylase [Deltaproteobacteria bacterium]
MAQETEIDRVVLWLQRARRVLFITGAGISADSGLPTYRGIGGLYNRETTDEGYSIEEALSGQMFQEHPEITWKYVCQIAAASKDATFNRAHEFIAWLQTQARTVWVLTQNVDGFHRQAGSTNVIDIHGDVHDLTCTRCPYGSRVTDYTKLPPLPHCPECKGVLRPKVVLFGELLPPDKVALMHRELETGFDLMFSIGTSSIFPYISGPIFKARRLGVPTVEINPETTDVSAVVDVRLTAGAAVTCDALWRRLEAARSSATR